MRQQLAVPVMAHPNASRRDIRADRWLEQRDSVQVGNHTLNVLYAPGHIDDQLCFVLADDERVIVGDTIFAGGPGRTRSSADFQTTLNTLRTVVLPGPMRPSVIPATVRAFVWATFVRQLKPLSTRITAHFTAMRNGICSA
ncbi:MAG: MBL fold metallo-hydrolase [Caldilineaceae bacterium]